MPALAIHKTMMKPDDLKEFTADFKKLRDACVTAKLYLEHEDAHIASAAGMKKTWRAAIDFGETLKRIHDKESWRDSYGSFIDLLRAVPISKPYAYRLMSCAEILGTIPKAQIGKIQTPLSIRNIELLGDATPEEQETTLDDAAANGADVAFSKLRKLLDDMPDDETNAEGEAPKKLAGIPWMKRHLSSGQKWFVAHGLGDAAKAYTDALIALAESIEEGTALETQAG